MRGLTDASIKKLPPPETGNRVVYDVLVRNLGVRVTAAGSRSFILNYRVRGSGRQRRYTISATPRIGRSAPPAPKPSACAG